MNNRIITRISAMILLGALAVSACDGAALQETQAPLGTPENPNGTAAAAPNNRFVLEDCQISAPGSSVHLAARCGKLSVFENPQGGGTQISLHIAVIPAVSRNPAPDPLFFLTGGPGQAATESYPLLASAFDRINAKRDIVLVDQRGTGASNPLSCPEADANPDLATVDTRTEVQACLDALDAQPQFYTTSVAMHDLDQVRAALGYTQINLYGLSYGTRAALTYLQLYPDRVRSIILDGVVPQDEALGSDVARDAQRALDMIFERCASSAPCATAFPNVRAEFDGLLAALDDAPVQVRLDHPSRGESFELTFRAEEMATAVRLLSYSPETAALLPLLIHQAYSQEDYAPLAAQYLIVAGELTESLSVGMNFSVLCAEDVPFFPAASDPPGSEGAYLGNLQIEQLNEVCAVWPRGEIPTGFKEPVVSDVPALLLSGEADPVTPPENGEQVARTLSNSLHLVVPGQGHNVIYRGCLPRLAADFVESGSTAGLAASCIDQIQPMPFFVNPSGPYSRP